MRISKAKRVVVTNQLTEQWDGYTSGCSGSRCAVIRVTWSITVIALDKRSYGNLISVAGFQPPQMLLPHPGSSITQIPVMHLVCITET